MIPQPIAVTGNRNDNRMMQETITQGRCHDRITEHVTPGRNPVGWHDRRSMVIVDKAYDYNDLLARVAEDKGAAVIPSKSNRKV